MEDTQNESDKDLEEDTTKMNGDPMSIVNDKLTARKKQQLSDLCNTDDESDLSAIKSIEENREKGGRGGHSKRGYHGRREGHANK